MGKQSISLLDIINTRLKNDKTLLPVFDATGMLIQQEIQRDEPDIQRIENIIIRDQGLTSQVLKTANSAFYKGLTKVSTVKTAIVRLGVNEIANMVIMAAHGKHFNASDAWGRQLMHDLWRHAIGTAIGTQWLAKEQGLGAIAHEAFTAALLHDVGKLLLYSVMASLRKQSRININPSNELIREVMENFHSQYGFMLLKTWNLPEGYCTVTRDHHLESKDTDPVLLLMVRLVNMACHKIGIGLKHEPGIILAATPEASALGVSEITLAKLEIKLEDSQLLAGDRFTR